MYPSAIAQLRLPRFFIAVRCFPQPRASNTSYVQLLSRFLGRLAASPQKVESGRLDLVNDHGRSEVVLFLGDGRCQAGSMDRGLAGAPLAPGLLHLGAELADSCRQVADRLDQARRGGRVAA